MSEAEVALARITQMEEGAESTLFDEDGSAVIVHVNPDTYQAEAGAGDRIACGVITLRQ